MSNIKTYAFIFARAGSKGLKNKNLFKIGGKPLIAHSIEAAQNNKKIHKVFVSSDSKEIKNVSRDYGAEIIDYKQSSLFPVLADVPELGVELVRLKREVEIQNTLFVFLTQQYEEAKIKEAKDTPTIQVLDYPQKPFQKSAPKRVIILIICLFISTFVNVLFILYRSELKI